MSDSNGHAVFTHNKNIYDDPTRYFPQDTNVYLCIDLKSFYASVECVERGLDPMTAKLVVADPERSKGTICLAVSPALKALGVKNRCRIYEIPDGVDYITAPPQMQHYIDCSAEIYGVYLQYIAKEDIHVYSIDEAFLDVTSYLSLYKMTAKELGIEIMAAIHDRTGIRATCGIGTNLYLCKVALDITAKHSPDFIGILTEDTYKATLWEHKPLTDFWQVGPGTANRLARYGIFTMGAIAKTAKKDEDFFYRLFGVNAEILIDHANGTEPVRMADIKNYKGKEKSLSSGQVLMRDYSYMEALTVAKEMMQELCMDLTKKGLVTASITLHVSYSHNWKDRYGMPAAHSHGTISVPHATDDASVWLKKIHALYVRAVRNGIPIRRINITCNHVVPAQESASSFQFSLFDTEGRFTEDICSSVEEQDRNHRLQEALLEVRRRYGKNAVLKGIDLEEAATGRERNLQIGGHKSGTIE